MDRARYTIAADVAWRLVDNQVFAVTLDGNLHLVDSATGVLIWTALSNGTETLPELVEQIVDGFDVAPARATADLAEFLGALVSKRVLVRTP